MHSSLPAVRSVVATAAPASAPNSSSATSATLKITIPPARAASGKRRPAYVSPATQSITIAQDTGAPQTLSLAANSPNCVASAGGRACTIGIAATPGTNQLFKLSLYASTDGSGTPLATQSIVKSILAGQNNAIDVVLDGVVASLSLFLQNPTMTTGTAGSTNVVLNAVDAAGAIIAGPGVYADANANPIVITLTDSDASGATHLASTTATSAATIALSYTGAATSNVTISASAPALATAVTTLGFRSSGSAATAGQMTAALSSTQNYYATLPHVNLENDLSMLAAEMVASGAYASAAVSAGGISATFPDGSPAFIFADRIEDLNPSYAGSARKRAPSAADLRKRNITNDTLGTHSIIYLTNFIDTRAFTIQNQNAFAEAYQKAGYAPPEHEVASAEMTLDNVLTIGANANLDLLDIATHGGVRTDAQGYGFYTLESDTPINDATMAQYESDISAGTLVASTSLLSNGTTIPTFAFTMDFLKTHLVFNPGAIFLNQSCFGASSIILPTISQTLQGAGVGRYFGWTKAVGGGDADDTDAFIVDRLLGETGDPPTGMSQFIKQRSPAQRAFPLDDIDGVLATETRNDPLEVSTLDYAESDVHYMPNNVYPPTSDGTLARLVVSDFGGESVATPVDEYMPPSIENVTIDEPTSTMTIHGSFPGTTPTVLISDGGNNVQSLTVTNVTSSALTVTLPAAGSGSAGIVEVVSEHGIKSNDVPITQWTGRLYYHETDAIPDVGGVNGAGNGTLDVKYNLDVRANVAPTVATIDTDPVAQNFAFNNPQSDSTASLFNYTGDFVSNDGKVVLDFSLPQSSSMIPSEPPLDQGLFEVRGFIENQQPSPCNNGMQGPEGDAGNVLCPITGWFANENAVVCTDSGQNSACPGPDLYDTIGSYGAGFDAGGLLSLTMDPATYRVGVAAQTTSFFGFHFGSEGNPDRNATSSMNGSFDAPSFVPTYSIPASSSHRRNGSSHKRAFVPMPASWKYPRVPARTTVERIGVKPSALKRK